MAERDHGWLRPALRRQAALATAAIAVFCLLALLGLEFDLGAQMAILLVGIVLVGFPHGAFDHLVAQPVLQPRLGRRWLLPFLLGYLGLAGVVLYAWTIVPAATLALFLAGSVLHFGLGDTEDGLVPERVPRWLGILTYGALPVLLPIALQPEASAPVLAVMAEWDLPVMEHTLGRAIWLLPLWGIVFAWMIAAAGREGRGVLERLTTAAGFVLLPPLLAFGLYFAFGHSMRHVLRLGAWRDANRPAVAARWAVRVMLPASAICAAGLAGLWMLDADATSGLLAPAFRIIAALTLPHMIVTSWLEPRDAHAA